MIADDLPLPVGLDLTVSFATDDVLVFARWSKSVAREAVSRIDAAINDCGIEAHHGKDVDNALDSIVIGVDVADGVMLAP